MEGKMEIRASLPRAVFVVWLSPHILMYVCMYGREHPRASTSDINTMEWSVMQEVRGNIQIEWDMIDYCQHLIIETVTFISFLYFLNSFRFELQNDKIMLYQDVVPGSTSTCNRQQDEDDRMKAEKCFFLRSFHPNWIIFCYWIYSEDEEWGSVMRLI